MFRMKLITITIINNITDLTPDNLEDTINDINKVIIQNQNHLYVILVALVY